MAIYITGDTHGDFQRFGSKYFPQQKEMSREDYVVVAGDFGGLWDGSQGPPPHLPHLVGMAAHTACSGQ